MFALLLRLRVRSHFLRLNFLDDPVTDDVLTNDGHIAGDRCTEGKVLAQLNHALPVVALRVAHCVVGVVKWINFHSLSLLYSATRDGFSSKAFHGRCDGSGATLVLVRSVAGHVFGGYTPTDWGASSRLDCKESFIFHVTCENGAAPQRYSRRWSSSCMSQQQDSYNTAWFSQPVEPFHDANGSCADNCKAGLYNTHCPRKIDASKGPTFGARHLMMYGSTPIAESLCNDMIINLDSRHGVARFISFYNDVDGRRGHAFTPHPVKKHFFTVIYKHPRQSGTGGACPPPCWLTRASRKHLFEREPPITSFGIQWLCLVLRWLTWKYSM
jgi:hypothetical protein